MAQFDANGDGVLNKEERRAARKHQQQGRGGPGPEAASSNLIPTSGSLETDVAESKAQASDREAGLYDDRVLRTLYLRFEDAEWCDEMGDFYQTDVDVTADLVVDGQVYPAVGVHFRGSASHAAIGQSQKKSLNISVDYCHQDQRLFGYRTLNLLNSFSDPSFTRDVLFARVCRDYIPAPRTNLVKVVINGENWGIYVNAQQMNGDFIQEWFGTRSGSRWRVLHNVQGDGSLAWCGADASDYEGTYLLKSSDTDSAWHGLARLCASLAETPSDLLETALGNLLDIDEALWFIALENVFVDNDGYVLKGADYVLYQDIIGRFHIFPYDNNDAFRRPRGMAVPGRDERLSPVAQETNSARPLVSRLLSVPYWRARYLAHVRTIVDEWLDWDKIEPIVDQYYALIDDEVRRDERKLYSYESFIECRAAEHMVSNALATTSGSSSASAQGPPGSSQGPPGTSQGLSPFGQGVSNTQSTETIMSLRSFVLERRQHLLEHLELLRPQPVVESVTRTGTPQDGKAVPVLARVVLDSRVDKVILHYATGRLAPFKTVEMLDDGRHNDGALGDGVFGVSIPPLAAGTWVRYYVEARSEPAIGTAAFYPRRAEREALVYRVPFRPGERRRVVVNEVVADNAKGPRDPQGEREDWIELYNVTDRAHDLTGMYLSDDPGTPRKWAFPEGTVIAPKGYLLVWADRDVRDTPGLHAGFALSKAGETVILVDSDERGNQVIDVVELGVQIPGVAFGRLPDGVGQFGHVRMTPGTANRRLNLMVNQDVFDVSALQRSRSGQAWRK